MIQELLEANFLKDIGDDETKLDHLNKTVQSLVAQFPKETINLIPATLTAFDPQTKANDRMLDMVEIELKKHWQLYSNVFRTGKPIELLRAILIETLFHLAQNQDNFAAIIWYTGKSYLSSKKVGNEFKLLGEFLMKIGERIEKKITDQWYLTIDHQLIKDRIEGIFKTSRAISPDSTPIQESLAKIWSTDTNTINTKSFVTIASTINEQLKSATNKASENLQKPINELTVLVSEEVFKNKLLWWKESKFSETLKSSYREIDKIVAAVMMAYDLHLMMPTLHPQSVEYFLKESIWSLSANDEKLTVLEFAQLFKESIDKSNLTDRFPLVNIEIPEGRQSLAGTLKIALSVNPISQAIVDDNLNNNDEQFSTADFAVWCFRDLQALKIAKITKRRK